ncbi:MAG: WD40/YVTN/BNR-like repeat-containing protein [Bdellovibrionota bacterium]
MKAFLASRKGLFVYKLAGSTWKLEKHHFDGVRTSYVSYNPAKKQVWLGMAHGHWGPKVHMSKDKGKTFQELPTPKVPTDDKAKSLTDIWAFAFDKTGRVYVGTSPAEIFHSDDNGQTWVHNEALHTMQGREKWFAGASGGHCVHSILVHPENPDHIVIGISVGGVLESTNRGKSWEYRNDGMQAYFMPDPNDPVVQDPHLVARAPSDPQILWQQNHCGIFKSENGGKSWSDLSKAKGLKTPFGWGVVIDDKDANVAYTVPAQSDETRVPYQKKLIVQKTVNGGKSWSVLTNGLPQKNCFDIVYRHAFSGAGKRLLFGTTTGHVFFSHNEGKKWGQIKDYLPPIYGVKLVDL